MLLQSLYMSSSFNSVFTDVEVAHTRSWYNPDTFTDAGPCAVAW